MEDRQNESNQPNNDKKIKRGKGAPGRDPRGVRMNNYHETMKQYKEPQNRDKQAENVLLETMINKISQPDGSGAGDVVIQKTGQPPKYPTIESLINKYTEYLLYIYEANTERGGDLIPDIEGFCSFADISRETFYEWEKSRPEAYSDQIKRIKTDIAAYKKQLGLHGKIPPLVLAMDFNNNHGYTQQSKLDVNTNIRIEELPSADDIARRLPSGD